VKVRMRTTYADRRGRTAGPGQVLELPDGEAAGLIAGGYATEETGPPLARGGAENRKLSTENQDAGTLSPPRAAGPAPAGSGPAVSDDADAEKPHPRHAPRPPRARK